MSNNLSADTLFHFMKKYEYLEAALKQEFSPRYYKEDLTPFFESEPVYIAMKCFCDIPLSMVKKHADRYGYYAIGFSKEWGIKNKLNPVTYYNPESDFIESISKAYNSSERSIKKLYKKIRKREDVDETVYFGTLGNISKMQCAFMNFKPYKGRMWDSKNEKWEDDIPFYNEREWRKNIMPSPKSKINEHISGFYYEKEVNADVLEERNRRLSSYRRIKYDYKDVKFIIVSGDDDIIRVCDLIDSIDDIKMDINPSILKTKILKFEDIEANM